MITFHPGAIANAIRDALECGYTSESMACDMAALAIMPEPTEELRRAIRKVWNEKFRIWGVMG